MKINEIVDRSRPRLRTYFWIVDRSRPRLRGLDFARSILYMKRGVDAMRTEPPKKLYPLRDACKVLGVSYPALKQWIYKGKIKTVKTPGGHHRIPETEIDRLLPAVPQRGTVQTRRESFRTISGRNQLVGRVVELKIEGLMAQVTLSIAGQRLTAIITADAVREMRLEKGQIAAALVKSTDVMVMRAR
jgi:molybdopterin-binding protein